MDIDTPDRGPRMQQHGGRQLNTQPHIPDKRIIGDRATAQKTAKIDARPIPIIGPMISDISSALNWRQPIRVPRTNPDKIPTGVVNIAPTPHSGNPIEPKSTAPNTQSITAL